MKNTTTSLLLVSALTLVVILAFLSTSANASSSSSSEEKAKLEEEGPKIMEGVVKNSMDKVRHVFGSLNKKMKIMSDNINAAMKNEAEKNSGRLYAHTAEKARRKVEELNADIAEDDEDRNTNTPVFDEDTPHKEL